MIYLYVKPTILKGENLIMGTTIASFFATLTLSSLLPAIIILVVGLIVIKLLLKLVDRSLAKSKLEKSAHPMIRSILRALLFIILALIVASQLGFDVSSLVALLSVLTLAVSLAVQDLLANILGGLAILTTHPFKSGDFVEIAGKSGTVVGVGITYTTLTTPDNLTVSIPNSAITSAQIVNYTQQGTRRVEFSISASYDSDPETVKAALLEAANVPTSLFTPAPFAGIRSYGDSAIVYTLHVWSSAADYWTTYYAVNENISKTFQASGIEMTYPHLNVHLDK